MVTYLSPTTTRDPYSGADVGEDWSTPQHTDAPTAFVLSATEATTGDGTNVTTVETWTLYIPTGEVEPRPGDRVESDGEVFVIEGRPIRERNPFTGWAPYARARLTRGGA